MLFPAAESKRGIPDKKVNRVRIPMSDDMIEIPLFGRSVLLLHLLTKSDRLISIPTGYEGMRKGSAVSVVLS